MRAIRAATAALLGASVLALAAPVALAGGNGGDPLFAVAPSTVAPGGRVALSANGCASTATATSGVFDSASIRPGGSTTVTVDRDARRGAQYSIRFSCGDAQKTVILTISGGTASPTISTTVRPPVAPSPTVPATPARTTAPAPTTTATATRTATATAPATTPQGVRGGLGGSVTGGAGPVEFAAGAALVLAAATATAVVLRRRTGVRRH
ncbi:hypothetical protein AB0G74_14860 [Streptomyces sp. NPDC020875]|uniref:hypothetical protein n=1 Tax=Streptomyces sp. NPDC020875 TaxID=3154898 RepID=UPI0033E7A4BB